MIVFVDCSVYMYHNFDLTYHYLFACPAKEMPFDKAICSYCASMPLKVV